MSVLELTASVGLTRTGISARLVFRSSSLHAICVGKALSGRLLAEVQRLRRIC